MKKTLCLILVMISFVLFSTFNVASDVNIWLAAVQFPELQHQTKQDFFDMLDDYIKKAQKQQVKIILFPELLTLNLLTQSDHPSVAQLSDLAKFTDEYIIHLKSKALSSGMIIVGGTTCTKKNNKIYNTAIVAFPNGTIKTVDKSLLTPWELSNNITGVGMNQPLSFQTPWGNVVILICYEIESADILSKISKFNPNIVLIPSSTSGLYGLERVQIGARYIAIEQFAYTLLTGVITGLSHDQVGDNSVGQAIFASPAKEDYPLIPKLGRFNQPDLFVVNAKISKIRDDKLSPQSTYAARDYALQHH